MIKGFQLKSANYAPHLLIVVTMVILVGVDGYNFLRFLYIPPFLSLAALYYWCVHALRTPSYVLVFSLGILLDILSGASIGQNALIFLLVHYGVSYQREWLRTAFRREWVAFGGVLLGVAAIENAILYTLNGLTLCLWEVVWEGCITFIFYPFVYKALRFLWILR